MSSRFTAEPLRIVVLGLSITSSWGNGHATNFRALQRAMTEAGHDVLFLERDTTWYAAARDLPRPPWGRTELYSSLADLHRQFAAAIRQADLVIVGSYVPEGRHVASWVQRRAGGVTAFYDIDTPVTLAALARGACEYLDTKLVQGFDLYLSFSAGPALQELEERYGARRAVAFPCLVDPAEYRPVSAVPRWDLSYLGTYSEDRQAVLERLLIEPARMRPDLSFVVAGPQYPSGIDWPTNVERIEHVAPPQHPAFYAASRATLNITRAEMSRIGWSPSVRLFEAGACAVPVISDRWEGLDSFFVPGREILTASSSEEVLACLVQLDAHRRARLGEAARRRVLDEHTAQCRVAQLEQLVAETQVAGRDVRHGERSEVS